MFTDGRRGGSSRGKAKGGITEATRNRARNGATGVPLSLSLFTSLRFISRHLTLGSFVLPQEALRLEAEAERAKQEQAQRHAEEEAGRLAQAERDERKAKTQAEYMESLQVKNPINPAQIVRAGSARSLVVGSGEDMLAGTVADDFSKVLTDEEMDEMERAELAKLRRQREREEILRKKQLKEEHEARLRLEQEAQMRALQDIIDQKQREKERQEAELAVCVLERIHTLDSSVCFLVNRLQ